MSRVTEIRYVGYGVEDFDAERTFYAEDWGLVEVARQDDFAWFKTHGHDEHHVVRLHKSDANHVEVIAFAADTRADVDALHERIVAAGCKVIFAPRDLDAPGGGYGLRFFSPDGLPFEISAEVARSTSRAMARWEGMPCFLRCNEAHHRVAILPGPPCLNHVAYDMLTVDDMFRGAHRLKQRGTDLRWGPGRHTAGNNTFSYFTTPAGFAVEYTSELEEVDFETHQHKVHVPGPQVMDQWGIGVGGPQTMPHPKPDARLFQAAEL